MKFQLFVTALFLIVLPPSVLGLEYSIDEKIQLREDGSAYITLNWSAFNDSSFYAWQPFSLTNSLNLSNFTAYDDLKRPLNISFNEAGNTTKVNVSFNLSTEYPTVSNFEISFTVTPLAKIGNVGWVSWSWGNETFDLPIVIEYILPEFYYADAYESSKNPDLKIENSLQHISFAGLARKGEYFETGILGFVPANPNLVFVRKLDKNVTTDENIVVSIEITNSGNVDLKQAEILDDVPAQFKLVNGKTGWSGALKSGESTSLTYIISPLVKGKLTLPALSVTYTDSFSRDYSKSVDAVTIISKSKDIEFAGIKITKEVPLYALILAIIGFIGWLWLNSEKILKMLIEKRKVILQIFIIVLILLFLVFELTRGIILAVAYFYGIPWAILFLYHKLFEKQKTGSILKSKRYLITLVTWMALTIFFFAKRV